MILAAMPRLGYLAVPPAPVPEPEPDPGEQPPDVPTAGAVLLGAHPTVAANPHDGHAVTSLMARDGVLLMGYGDWTYNTGPLDLLGLDLATGEPVTLHTGVRTECIEVWRVIDGDLYVPWIDTRSGYDHLGGGYLTDAGGTWHEVVVPDLVHTFDVARVGDDLLAVGSSRATNRACVKRSSDGGGTWVDITPNHRPVNHMRQHSVIAPGDGAAYLPTLGRWSPESGWTPLPIFEQDHVNLIAGQVPELDGVHYSAGFAVGNDGAVVGYPWRIVPQAVDGAVLYGTRRWDTATTLYTSPGIADGGIEWEPLCNLPLDLVTPRTLTMSQRVEVHDGHVYVGGTQGRVWRVTP